MLTIINTLFFAVGLIALVAFVLLMIAGFKRSLWWGLALHAGEAVSIAHHCAVIP